MEIRAQTAPAAMIGGLEYSRETPDLEEPIEHTDDMTKQSLLQTRSPQKISILHYN